MSNVKFDFEAKIIVIINYVLNFILAIRFVASSTNAALKKDESSGATENKDEIDIDDSDDEDEPVAIAKQAVPSAVFGKLDEDEKSEE